MEIALDGGKTLQTVVVCHPNKVLLNLGKLHAERHGLRVITARNGNDVIEKARVHRPDLIVLSNDLRNPTTDETLAKLEQDPSLKGIRVVVVKGALPNMKDILGKFPGVPWQRE